ncbi:helix-turn-helix transcriptional regulator [Paenisporosarcina sp. FSL H8-0542]|uniref:helix-turn-helix domain-containing protein n=1 Tax=Paenisporosarcina sp. FSL H8-0542 TaxID=2921401 RepID=UPI00315B2804
MAVEYLLVIGKNIKRLRLSRNITQKKFAEIIGVKPNTLSGYESGKRTPDPKDFRLYYELL